MSILPPSCIAATFESKGLMRCKPYLQRSNNLAEPSSSSAKSAAHKNQILKNEADVYLPTLLYCIPTLLYYIREHGTDALQTIPAKK